MTTLEKHVRAIVRDEALTRGLADPEARLLVEWLVEQAERLAQRLPGAEVLAEAVDRLQQRGRAISRFVYLWCYARSRGAACQLAACQRFSWPLPTAAQDPCTLMQHILEHEGDALGAK
jgi:hypothetical protein